MENDQPTGDTPEVIADSQAPVATEAAPEQQAAEVLANANPSVKEVFEEASARASAVKWTVAEPQSKAPLPKVTLPKDLQDTRPEDEAVEEVEIESTEMIDDPVRMYLREIGRVSLLTAQDERSLARRMEAGKHVTALRKYLSEDSGRTPSAVQVTVELLRRLASTYPVTSELADHLGLEPPITLRHIMEETKIRAAIDNEMKMDIVHGAQRNHGHRGDRRRSRDHQPLPEQPPAGPAGDGNHRD